MNRQQWDDRPLIRRDSDGRERTAPDWESLTERLIREAQQAGHFDDLPSFGRPLPPDDGALAGDMAAANGILRNAGAAPPWIEADKAVRAQRTRIEQLLAQAQRSSPPATKRLRRELERAADAHDEAVRQLEPLAPTTKQQRRPLDRAQLATRLAAALDREPEAR